MVSLSVEVVVVDVVVVVVAVVVRTVDDVVVDLKTKLVENLIQNTSILIGQVFPIRVKIGKSQLISTADPQKVETYEKH